MRYSGSLTKLSSRGGTHQSAMEPESTDIECEMVSSFELLNGDPTATVDRLPRRVSSLHLEMDYVLSSVTSSLLKTPARPRRSQPRPLLLSALEAAEIFPDLVAERPFIMGGYRRPGSMQQCASSVWSLHNETGNIWTHLLGGSAFTALALLQGALPQLCPECVLSVEDRLALAVYLLGAVFCLATSTAFHTFCCCSKEAFHRYKRLDHMGVLGLLAASDIPMIHFGFYHHARLRALYLTLVSALLLLAGFVLLSPRVKDVKYMPLRLGVFFALVVIGWTHMAHEVSLKGGLSTHEGRISLRCWVLPFSAYITGVVLLISRLPERIQPGKFDIWCHSHQLWHICVLLGASLQWWSVMLYLRMAKGLSVT